MIYASHKAIPAPLRRVILEETMQTRVANVTLATCNQIIADYLEQQKENAQLRRFSVTIVRNGVTETRTYTDVEDALVAIDREMDYEYVGGSFVAFIHQANRLIRAYANNAWHYPAAKDAVVIKKIGATT